MSPAGLVTETLAYDGGRQVTVYVVIRQCRLRLRPSLGDLPGPEHGDPGEHRLEGISQGPGIVDDLP